MTGAPRHGRPRGIAAALLCGSACSLAPPPRAVPTAAAAPPTLPAEAGVHVGPVTSVVATQHGFVACSQAGVRWLAGTRAPAVPFRPFALASLGDDALVVAGGAPARSGRAVRLDPRGVGAPCDIAEDVCYAVAVAPDRSRVALGDADGRVHLLALSDLELPGAPPRDPAATLAPEVEDAHTAACRAVAFSPDGELLVSAGLDGVVRIRNLSTGASLRLVDHTAGVECLAIAARGDRIASGAKDGKVRVHGRDGRLRRSFLHLGAEVTGLAWHGDGLLVAGTSDGRVLLLADALDGEVREVAHLDAPIFALAIADGHVAVGVPGRVVTLALPPVAR